LSVMRLFVPALGSLTAAPRHGSDRLLHDELHWLDDPDRSDCSPLPRTNWSTASRFNFPLLILGGICVSPSTRSTAVPAQHLRPSGFFNR